MPNRFIEKARSKFDYYADKVISKTSPKVQKEIKRVASKSVDNLITSAIDIINFGISASFIYLLIKDLGKRSEIVPEKAYSELLGRGICIVYNDVKNTYNYYKEVA